MSESQEQKALVRWFNLQYPKMAGLLFAIPNGSHLAGDAVTRAKKMHRMKAEGLRPGVSDLFLMIPRKGAHGMWIEMKADKGVTSQAQNAFQLDAKEQGYAAITCHGFDMARGAIEEYLS